MAIREYVEWSEMVKVVHSRQGIPEEMTQTNST